MQLEWPIIIETIIIFISSMIVGFVGSAIKFYYDTKVGKKEDSEINAEVKRVVGLIDKGEKDVLALMIKNVAELREYYVINKMQARRSFSAALFISFLGFMLFASGIIIGYINNLPNAPLYSTIGGSIVEIIAGLFFWLYSKAISQINLFHTSLLKTEKFLTAIQLTEKISAEHRDGMYSFIISNIIAPSLNPDPPMKLTTTKTSPDKQE